MDMSSHTSEQRKKCAQRKRKKITSSPSRALPEGEDVLESFGGLEQDHVDTAPLAVVGLGAIVSVDRRRCPAAMAASPPTVGVTCNQRGQVEESPVGSRGAALRHTYVCQTSHRSSVHAQAMGYSSSGHYTTG
jgi:hypothetical protein